MSHLITTPPPDSGGGSLVAGGSANVVVTWIPPHDMKPKAERNRIERAETMRQEIINMLNAPYGAHMGEHDE